MDDLETRLSAWGREWRATQDIGVPPFEVPRTQRPLQRAWTGMRAVTGVLVVAVVLVGALALRGNFLRQGSLPVGAANTGTVSPGDVVQASGAIVAQPDGTLMVCLPKLDWLTTLDQVGCSDVAVRVRGIQPASIPGWTTENGVSFARSVTVRGGWSNGGIDVTTVALGAPTDQPSVPCGVVAGEAPPTGLAGEAALASLDSVIDADPGKYGGRWSATGQDGALVAVVGIAGAVGSSEAGLAATYPYKLCLTAVTRSLADLQATAEELQRSHPQWLPTVDLPHNRVAILVSVLDSAMASQLSSLGDVVYVRSLVREATSP